MALPVFKTSTKLDPSFDNDIRDVHLIYFYDAENPDTGTAEKWKYEMWFFSENRILWQCNWLEETGTICSLVYDITRGEVTTLLGFSKGHWEHPKQAHGNKRDPETFERWRKLADIGRQTDRFMLADKAKIAEKFKGKGELVPIDPEAPTI